MSPGPSASTGVRSSTAVNAEIRRLWTDPRVRLTGEQRAEYEQLVAEWAAAIRAEVAKAA